jgi:hypothetical protein
VNDDIQSINSIKSISSLLCQAISSISSDCVQHLEKCLDAEDVIIMSENHIEQLKLYFVKLAGDNVDNHFHLDNCQEPLDDSVISSKDIRNTLEDDFLEEDDIETMENKEHNSIHEVKNVEEGTPSIDIEQSIDIEKYYVNDENDSEEAVQEELVKYVSKKNYDISVSSSAVHLNLNFLPLLICFLYIH